ncbi:MAG: hypothetical protein Q9186_005919 [Xanthomendoza sp. 1 TL-2023]
MDEPSIPLTTSTAHLKGTLGLEPGCKNFAIDWIAAIALHIEGVTAKHLFLAAATLGFGDISDLDIYNLLLSMHFTKDIGRSKNYHHWKELPFADGEARERKSHDKEVELLKEEILDRLLESYHLLYVNAMRDARKQLVHPEFERHPEEQSSVARNVGLLTDPQPDDWIGKMTLVQQMESIGLFQEGVELEADAIFLFRPEERRKAVDYSSQIPEERRRSRGRSVGPREVSHGEDSTCLVRMEHSANPHTNQEDERATEDDEYTKVMAWLAKSKKTVRLRNK